MHRTAAIYASGSVADIRCNGIFAIYPIVLTADIEEIDVAPKNPLIKDLANMDNFKINIVKDRGR